MVNSRVENPISGLNGFLCLFSKQKKIWIDNGEEGNNSKLVGLQIFQILFAKVKRSLTMPLLSESL